MMMVTWQWMRARRALGLATAVVAAMALPSVAQGAGSHDHHGAAAAPTASPRAAAGLQRWSDPATWGGRVPAAGAAVTIPKGRTVLLDRDVSLRSLTINGTLRFARRNTTLTSDWIMVHGALQVGTASAPFLQRAIIRLRDARRNEDVMGMGDKLIGVMGGTLDLHGARRVTWTRLGATAPRGADRIVLSRAAGWRAGDRIAIASTDFASEQAEEVTITSVAGRVLTLDEPLEYTHFGKLQRYAGRTLDERAEVALLSRNVTVEGEATSSAAGFGAQVMVMDGVARISGVELQRVGQLGKLRRYPLHFHMLGDGGRNSYLRSSSIHHSNNRCVTIHGTNRATVAGNACFDHVGHGVFLEDGAEQGNRITDNLVFRTRRAPERTRLLPSDASPASYWITNPANVVRGNVAGGSEGHGFWIALPEHPTGLSATLHPGAAKRTWPRRMALASFVGNSAHSNAQDGLNFDHGPRPDGKTEATWHRAHADPADDESKLLVTTISRFSSWKNRDHGVWLRGSEHRLVDSTLADNGTGAVFASDESFLQRALVVGESANVGTPAEWEVEEGGVGPGGRSLPRPWDDEHGIHGFEFYDGRVGVERSTFVNFQPYRAASGSVREHAAITYRMDNDFAIHPRNFVTSTRFVNARPTWFQTPEPGHDGSISSVFLDTDGSITGAPGRSVMPRNPFLYGAACEERGEWNAQVCTGDYATLHVDGGSAAAMRPVTLTRPDGRVQTLRASTGDDAHEASTSVLVRSAYRVDFNGGTPARSRFVLSNGRDRGARVSIPRREGFRVTRWGCDVTKARDWCFGAATSLANLEAANRTGYWYDDQGDGDPATGTLHLKLAAVDTDWDELVVEPA